jgi:hypothetical protein
VPNGFILYLLMDLLPGVRLGEGIRFEGVFWELSRPERDEIRKAVG